MLKCNGNYDLITTLLFTGDIPVTVQGLSEQLHTPKGMLWKKVFFGLWFWLKYVRIEGTDVLICNIFNFVSMGDEKELGVNGDRKFYELVKDVNYPNDELEKIIDLFSFYLNIFNNDFKYNQTYLNRYVNSFCECISYTQKKHSIFETIAIFIYNEFHDKLLDSEKILLNIDNLWQCTIVNADLYEMQDTQNKIEKLCSENTHLQCTYFGSKGRKYMTEIVKKTLNNGEIHGDSVGEIKETLQYFLIKYLGEGEV